jgi:glycosyltransferase
LNILKKYEDKIDVLISEKDNGIFDAMNKGIKYATGDIIAILNSDDYYYNKEVISEVVNKFKIEDVECLYGDLIMVSQDKRKIVRYWQGEYIYDSLWAKGIHPAHPTFFVKKEVYENYGKFSSDYLIASDYELMFRFLYLNKVKHCYFDYKFPLVVMRVGGNSNKSLKAVIKSNKEVLKIWKDNGITPPRFLIIKKIYYKIKQFFKIKEVKL